MAESLQGGTPRSGSSPAATPLLETPPPATGRRAEAVLACRGLSVFAGRRPILRRVDLEVPERRVTCVIGPSGAGKSTLLKSLNRMTDLDPGLRVSGEILFRGRSIRGREVDADRLRERIGMLFQQPVVFPQSISRNVLFGVRHLKTAPRREWPRVAARALERVGLFEEVRDRLDRPAAELSVGQQQRLCLARALALEPEVLLMDEPTSALDAAATAAIERLVEGLKRHHTIVLVTHDLEQARRLADRVACVCVRDGAGELLETRDSVDAFADPRCQGAVERIATEEAER